MARMPGATWRPVPNCTRGGQEAVYGVVLHIMEGTLDGSDSWFRNTSSEASAHFGVGKDGRIFQWVDTADRAWAQAAGNRTWLSIEHEGHSGDALTPQQLAATARIVAWAHAQHGVPLQLTDSPTGRGIGWHGMGGADWGGHYSCPGTLITAQRTAIITAAKSGATPTVQEDDMPTADEIADALMKKLGAPTGVLGTIDDPTKADDPKNPTADDQSLRAMLWTIGANAAHANAKADAILTGLTTLAAQVGADPTAFSKAVADDLAKRLES
jgi:hypothetical protein